MDLKYGIVKRITFLSLFKALLILLLMAFSVAANVLSPKPDLLKTQLQWIILGLISIEFTGVFTTAWIIKYRENWLKWFLIILLTADAFVTAALVHFTGGGMSPYYILFLVVIISCATTLDTRPTFYITFLSILLHVLVTVGGHTRILPFVEGQIVPPDTLSGVQLARQLAISISAFSAVSALSIYLAQRLDNAELSALEKTRELTLLRIRHRDILNSLSDSVLTVDEQGTIINLNKSARKLFGLSTMIGENIYKFLDKEKIPEKMGLSIRTFINEDIPVELTVTEIRSPKHNRKLKIFSIRDRSEVDYLEKEMAKQEKLAALGRMSASIAHEIRNPLASISGSLELLRTNISTVDGDENTELFNIVFEEVERLNAIVSEILNYTRTPKPDVQTNDFCDIATNIINLLKSDIRWSSRKIEFSSAEEITFDFDINLMKQIIINLIINGLESSPKSSILVHAVKIQDKVNITISDDGPGIPPDVLNKIYEPFFTTKTSGTGLGLSIVKKLVESHHGTIDFIVGDTGTTAKMSFPYKDSSEG